MSKENHPNFHACKFAAEITTAFYESIRNENLSKDDIEKIGEQITGKIIKFVSELEDVVDIVSEEQICWEKLRK